MAENLADYIHTQKHIATATIRIYRNNANPDWVDIDIADGNGLISDRYTRVATTTQDQLLQVIDSLKRHQLDKAKGD